MQNQFSRTELLIGREGIQKLQSAKVAIFGIGGVGSYVVEGLARAGVGQLVLIDKDCIDITNINRQIHATHKTVGMSKVEVMKDRVLEINPNAKVDIYQVEKMSFPEENILDNTFSYIVDTVDTISTKLKLIEKANTENIPIISAMGAGNKLDPTKFEVADIYKTSVCPLCRIMRRELKARNIKELKVVYSKEEPIKNENKVLRKHFICTISGWINNCRRSYKRFDKVSCFNQLIFLYKSYKNNCQFVSNII